MSQCRRFSRFRILVSIASAFSSVVLALPSLSTAQVGFCESLFVAEKPAASLKSQIEDVYARRQSGVTARGFISAFPDVHAETMREATAKGLMYWGLRIYIVKSILEAEAHWKSVTDPMMKGFYLLDRAGRFDFGKFDPESLETAKEGPAVFQTLYKNSELIQFQYADGLIASSDRPEASREVLLKGVDDDFVRANMNPEKIELHLTEKVPFVVQGGWAYTKLRGVVLTEDTVNSSTYKNLRYLMRRLYRQGWRITFNKDFVQSLNQVRDQLRLNNGKWQANSRFRNHELYQTTIEKFKKGSAISVEFWDPEGRLAGSVIGEVHGSLYSADSVSYNMTQYGQYTIDLAKIPFIALQERLEAAGIMMIDNGMVSHYTESLRGRYIDRADFDRRVEELQSRPNPAKPDFTTPYFPRGYSETK